MLSEVFLNVDKHFSIPWVTLCIKYIENFQKIYNEGLKLVLCVQNLICIDCTIPVTFIDFISLFSTSTAHITVC